MISWHVYWLKNWLHGTAYTIMTITIANRSILYFQSFTNIIILPMWKNSIFFARRLQHSLILNCRCIYGMSEHMQWCIGTIRFVTILYKLDQISGMCFWSRDAKLEVNLWSLRPRGRSSPVHAAFPLPVLHELWPRPYKCNDIIDWCQ